MARYMDSGSDDPTQCLGYWFNQNVVAGIKGFHAQFGYYGYRALYPFGDILKDTAAAGNPVHIVVGSNKGTLRERDLRWTFDLIDGAADASLAVVVFGNAEFHPKSVCVRRADETYAAVVGSGNLTEYAFGRNAEAMITLDSTDDGDGLFQQIINGVKYWQAGIGGVYPVTNSVSIDNLRDANLINVAQPPVTRPARVKGTAPGIKNPSTRKTSWLPASRPPSPAQPAPPVIPAAPAPAPAGPAAGPAAPAPIVVANAVPAAVLPANHGPILWQKELEASDCNRQPGHMTGGLRLAQAGFIGADGNVIDQTTYFRELFDGFNWIQTRQTPYAEDAEVAFRLIARGVDFGVVRLHVSHKPSGEAHQGNYTTSLKWKPFNAQIKALNLTGLTATLYGPAPATAEPYFIEIV
jgi:hypothetical protein